MNECPCCGWIGEFKSYGAVLRPNALCVGCRSLERHRLMCLFLKPNIPTDRPIKVLHFSPSKMVAELFRLDNVIEYVGTDIDGVRATIRIDMTKIPYPDDYFDIVLSCDVMEHIVDDIKAMSETYRVLKNGGFAVHQVPMLNTEKTYEDWTITNPDGRRIAFGQWDHVRMYGLDYKDRMESVGFDVEFIKYAESLGEDAKKYGLITEDDDESVKRWIYMCRKYGRTEIPKQTRRTSRQSKSSWVSL